MPLQRSVELEQLAQEAHAAWKRGDEDWFSTRLSSHDPVMLGSAPEEEMAGADAINAITSEELANRDHWEFKTTPPRVIDAREAGDIGWIVSESRWEFEDGSFLPVRGLAVLHREDGVWKYIAGVTAPAVPNELLRPGSPITQAAKVSA
jgi:SnoaL-like protein